MLSFFYFFSLNQEQKSLLKDSYEKLENISTKLSKSIYNKFFLQDLMKKAAKKELSILKNGVLLQT
jgi:hypothetical protein